MISKIKRGDIFFASYHFPHEDRAVTRQRPVLVLQCDEDLEGVVERIARLKIPIIH